MILQTIMFIFSDLCALGDFAGDIPISFLRFLRPLRSLRLNLLFRLVAASLR